MHYQRLIERFDRPETFFYIDPPYYGNEDDYGEGIFGRGDFVRLRDVLAGIQGKFIMSINDVPEIRGLFEGCSIEEVMTNYKMPGAHKQKRVTELLIRNYA
jgi:DNA adenine methylase